MALTFTFYNSFREIQLDGGEGSLSGPIDFTTDSIRLMLVNSSYTPSASTHTAQTNVDGYEVSGTNYTAGGSLITNNTVTETGGVATYDGDNVTWTYSASGFSNARYAILYKNDGSSNTTSPLIGYADFTADRGNTLGDLEVGWPATGIFTLS